ncbi:TPA: hypothetical protein HA265_07250 [Candidatus Woesearchaeota archaeon]|nr:hypothetical protein [Candidatus Woesearchaeota archaeon]
MKYAPLKSSFMLFAMLGFMISVVYTAYGRLDETWGFTLGLVFAIMFVASMISMTHAPIETQLMMAEGFIKRSPSSHRSHASSSHSSAKKK